MHVSVPAAQKPGPRFGGLLVGAEATEAGDLEDDVGAGIVEAGSELLDRGRVVERPGVGDLDGGVGVDGGEALLETVQEAQHGRTLETADEAELVRSPSSSRR